MADNKNSTVDGVRAVELFYRSIKEISSGDTVFYRTEMRLNAPNLGTMLPERYLAVLESSDRCIAMFKLAFVQLLQAMKKFDERNIDFDWISVYMPVRYLKNGGVIAEIKDICRRCNIKHEKICFEISPVIFEETGQAAAVNMASLREEGFHFMITGYGDEFFSMIKIADYSPDYFLLSPKATVSISKNERSRDCVNALKNFAEILGAEIIVDDITGNPQLAPFREAEFLYYTGAFAGNYMAERYMRTKNNSDDKNDIENSDENNND